MCRLAAENPVTVAIQPDHPGCCHWLFLSARMKPKNQDETKTAQMKQKNSLTRLRVLGAQK